MTDLKKKRCKYKFTYKFFYIQHTYIIGFSPVTPTQQHRNAFLAQHLSLIFQQIHRNLAEGLMIMSHDSKIVPKRTHITLYYLIEIFYSIPVLCGKLCGYCDKSPWHWCVMLCQSFCLNSIATSRPQPVGNQCQVMCEVVNLWWSAWLTGDTNINVATVSHAIVENATPHMVIDTSFINSPHRSCATLHNVYFMRKLNGPWYQIGLPLEQVTNEPITASTKSLNWCFRVF